jgi:transposase-like protein
MECPQCSATAKQHKIGFNKSGSQKYRCRVCGKTYTPQPSWNGYSPEIHTRAVRLYLEGNSLQGIGRILKVNPQSVSHWVRAHTVALPEACVPEHPKVAELDEANFAAKSGTHQLQISQIE